MSEADGREQACSEGGNPYRRRARPQYGAPQQNRIEYSPASLRHERIGAHEDRECERGAKCDPGDSQGWAEGKVQSHVQSYVRERDLHWEDAVVPDDEQG